MIKKIKTDNINIDILFNEIEHLKDELKTTSKEYREAQYNLIGFKEVYIPMTKHYIERIIEENRRLKEENKSLKELLNNT